MIHPKIKDGDTFSRLTVLDAYAVLNGRSWEHLVVCSCGTYRYVNARSLRTGATKSCGCLKKENMTTHGASKSVEFRVWSGMLQRCNSPGHISYKNYGARGIKVCSEWLQFENFLCDVGLRPDKSMSLDRINNDGNYEASNCRWATRFQQAINRRPRANKISGTEGIKGVRPHGIGWETYIGFNKKRLHLGHFDNLFDAACARISAENKYHRPRML